MSRDVPRESDTPGMARTVSMLLLSMRFDGWVPVWNQECTGCKFCEPRRDQSWHIDLRCWACGKPTVSVCAGPHDMEAVLAGMYEGSMRR